MALSLSAGPVSEPTPGSVRLTHLRCQSSTWSVAFEAEHLPASGSPDIPPGHGISDRSSSGSPFPPGGESGRGSAPGGPLDM